MSIYENKEAFKINSGDKPVNDGLYRVYFIRAITKANRSNFDPVKIGYSKDVNRRLTALQMGNFNKVELAMAMPVADLKFAKKLESFLHRQLKFCNIRGEWFNLRGVYMKKYIDKFEKSHKKWMTDNGYFVKASND